MKLFNCIDEDQKFMSVGLITDKYDSFNIECTSSCPNYKSCRRTYITGRGKETHVYLPGDENL